MSKEITSKNAHERYEGAGISNTGKGSIPNIEVNSEYPLVSFITMIAPSPDWFVGVHDFNLCNATTGKWEELRTRDLPPYDAGTDSGPFFKSSDSVTSPQEFIHLLTNNTEGSFQGDKPVRRFGTFSFKKTFDSNPAIKPSSSIVPGQRSSEKSSTTIIEAKDSSKQAETKTTSNAKPSIPTQTLMQTAAATVTASIQTTPGETTPPFTTTNGGCSVQQLAFIYVGFAAIFTKFCF